MKKALLLLLFVMSVPVVAEPAPIVSETLDNVAQALQNNKDESATAREFCEHLQAWKEGREPLSAYPYMAEVMRKYFIVPTEVLRELIAAGAEVNACGTKNAANGVTPLHLAAEAGNADICSMLLMHGADPTLRRADGATPLDLARSKGHEEVVLLLENRDEHLNRPEEKKNSF